MNCGKQTFFNEQTGTFFYLDERGNCIPIQFSVPAGRTGARGRKGDPGAAGAQGPAGPAGPSNLFANALFVDAVYGANAGAVPFSLMDSTNNPASHKYQTISAAVAAASAGDVIIVYPGDYTEATNLYKNGVTYYFYPDANVNGFFSNTVAGNSCSVFGHGNFFQTTSSSLMLLSAGSFYIQANNLTASFGLSAASMVALFGTGNTVTLQIDVNEIHCTDVRFIFKSGVGLTADILVNAKKITLDGITAFATQMININGGSGLANFDGSLRVDSDQIFLNQSFSFGTLLENRGSLPTSHIEINCLDITDNTPFNGVDDDDSSVVRLYQNAQGENIINGNVQVNHNRFLASKSSSPNLYFNINGNVICDEREVGFFTDTFSPNAQEGEFYFNGKNSTSVYAYTFDSQPVNPSTLILEVNGVVENTSVGGVGINKNDTLITIVLDTVKFLIPDAGGFSLQSTLPGDTYKTIFVSARQQANNNMANSIAGSIDYQDVNIQ